MKKLFILLFALCLLGACGCRVIEEPEPFHTEEGWNSEHVQIDARELDGYLFRIYSDKTCSLADVDEEKHPDKVLVLPEAYRDIPLVGIEAGLFAGRAYEEVVLPSRLEYIEDNAFRKCALRRVTLPDSVTRLGAECFDNCLFLEEVTFGKGLKEIPTGAFYSCPKLKEILLPEGVEIIGEEAFASCRAVEKVSLPSTLKTIGDYAFWRTGAESLVIEVPDGVAVGEHALEK